MAHGASLRYGRTCVNSATSRGSEPARWAIDRLYPGCFEPRSTFLKNFFVASAGV
jgi:hypothetical protein